MLRGAQLHNNARPLLAAGRWVQVQCWLSEQLPLEDGLWLELVGGTTEGKDQVEERAKND